MIKSNQGECEICGRGVDCVYDLNLIFSAVLEKEPELLTAVVTAWTPAIEKRFDNLDRKLVAALFKISNDLSERMEEDE